MRVLILHNHYRQRGGEDVVAEAQARVLREYGHTVQVFEKDNREIDAYGPWRKAALFFQMARPRASVAEVARLVSAFRPGVALVHNTLPLLSPGIYRPLKQAGVPVIQYLHNYRLVCAAGTLFRAGAPCRLCLEHGLRHAVKYGCWSNSRLAGLAFVRMLKYHRRRETWRSEVDVFVALNQFQRDLLVAAGVVEADRTVIQSNFAYVDAEPLAGPGDSFVYVGRLTVEKGVRLLREAHAQLDGVPLTLIGDGPEKGLPGQVCQALGALPRAEALAHVQRARALIFPSLWEEPFGLSMIEAMALAKPVIAARVAGPAAIVQDGVTGLLFEPGNVEALAECMRRLHADPALATRLGQAGRQRYLREYSPQAGYLRIAELCARLRVRDCEVPVGGMNHQDTRNSNNNSNGNNR